MNSPNSLTPPKAEVVKMRKWPLYLVSFALVCLFGILVYYVSFRAPKREPEKKAVEVSAPAPLVKIEGAGLALPPPAAPQDGKEKEGDKVVVVAPDKEADREQKELQRQKAQAYNKALVSPLLAKRVSHVSASQGTASTQREGSTSGVQRPDEDLERPMQEGDYNPAADRDKERFLKQKPDEWLSPYSREAGRPFEIKTGTVIPGMMVTGINSDLPGSMIAQVSQDVYDTATGGQLLVPQGAKLFGAYDSRVIYGQSRVLIAWNRIVFPDGSSVTLGTMPGADMSGYAGFHDQVDNHYTRIFGSAMLMSLISGGTSYALDSLDNSSGSDSNATTVQSALGTSMAAQLNQTTLNLLQRNLNIKPTLEIRPGYQFNIIVTKDVVFRNAYRR